MGNSLVHGAAPAIEIAGQLSDGILFQNLSPSVPLYIGYDPSVTSNSYAGYIAAGGSYTTPKGRAVFLYADADCPIVFDYTSDAQVGSGSSVNATPTNQTNSLLVGSVTSATGVYFLNRVSVASASAIKFRLVDNSPISSWIASGLFALTFEWLDTDYSLITTDMFYLLPGSRLAATLTTKGPILSVRLEADSFATVLTVTANIAAVAVSAREQWKLEPYWQSAQYHRTNFASVAQDKVANGALGFNASISPGQFAYYVAPSYSGRIKGITSISNGQVDISPWPTGLAATDAPYMSQFTTPSAGPSAAFELIAPRMPYLIRFANTSGNNTTCILGIGYELAA